MKRRKKGKRGLFLFPQRWRRGDDVPNGDQPPPTEERVRREGQITPRQLTHAEVGNLAREGDGCVFLWSTGMSCLFFSVL